MSHCISELKKGSLGLEQATAIDVFSNALSGANLVSTYHVNVSIFTSIPDN